ncbi:DUF3999 domain-containing protein [Stenotrophomonas mori]|uniref:DUF3999 domain-containing protein n=1 Tax=Stenotrophomonas mori TaxID=2871096 RepID=A0ABT0SDQ9_9GAMM|nr:DUF3999 domain-containing protein [Stenotrophomonas mori]MCL7713135.1 DUF3999 domain-containing protein [Stenotrophomonas mori]
MIKRLGWLALLPLTAPAADEFATQWPLQLAQDDAGAYRVVLEDGVYRAAYWRDLRDVQVLDADGRPMASAVQGAAVPTAGPARQVTLDWFALPASAAATAGEDLSVVVQRDAGGNVVSVRNTLGAAGAAKGDPSWLVDLGRQAGQVQALKVEWEGEPTAVDLGYRLEGSDDLRRWQVLDPEVRLVRLRNQGRQLNSDRIALSTPQRYLRLVPLQRDGAPPLRALHGELAGDTAAGDWRWVELAAPAADAGAPGRFRYRVQGRFPVQRLDVALPANSTVSWTVSSADDDRKVADAAQAWHVRASGWNTWTLQDGDRRQASAPLELGRETGDRDWQLQAEPAVAGTPAPALRLGYRPGSVVFLAQGRAPYLLVAGSARADVRETNLEPMLAALRAGNGAQWQPAVASLGEGAVRAGDKAYAPAAPVRDWKNLVLWAVLVAGALAVAGFAMSLLRGNRPAND